MTAVLRRRAVACAALVALFAGSPLAHADFREAVALYAAGRHAEARAEFLRLAELGDGAAQYNLAAMSLRGEATEKDTATAVGWMLAAAENGFAGVPSERVAAARAQQTPAEAARTQAVLDRYGRAALEARVLPPASGAWLACRDFEWPSRMAIPSVTPAVGFGDRQDGIVIIEFTIGVDGLARDPEVLIAVPERRFERDALNAYLGGRYEPARSEGRPVESRMLAHYIFTWQDGGRLWKVTAFDRLREQADAGEPAAQYVVGMAGYMDHTLEIPREAALDLLLKSAQGGQPQAQYWVARRMENGPACRDQARSGVWLEAAASGRQPSAQVVLARELLARPGAGPTEFARARELALAAAGSRNPYALKHAIVLLADPRLAPVDVAAVTAAAERLDGAGWKVDPFEHDALAVAATLRGDWAAAERSQRRALERAKALAWNTTAMEERLASYAQRRPWSGDPFVVPPRATPAPPPTGPLMRTDARPCTDGRCGRNNPDRPEAPTGTRILQ